LFGSQPVVGPAAQREVVDGGRPALAERVDVVELELVAPRRSSTRAGTSTTAGVGTSASTLVAATP